MPFPCWVNIGLRTLRGLSFTILMITFAGISHFFRIVPFGSSLLFLFSFVNMNYKLVRSPASGKSRFPKLDECAHFHYDHVELPGLKASLVSEEQLKQKDGKWLTVKVSTQDKCWLVRRTYDSFRVLDRQLHRCVYDRKFSDLAELGEDEKENLPKALSEYLDRFSEIAGSLISCATVLNWFELDNRGYRLLASDTDSSPINTPAVAAAYSVKKYEAQAPDELSFEIGDMISVIDMPSPKESNWWRGKLGLQVGFFPFDSVAVIGSTVPRYLQTGTKPILRKHGKAIAFFRSFILSRPSRPSLKQSGILKERVFGCDLGEHLLNTDSDIPLILKTCSEFIEQRGLVNGIYRLSGSATTIQKLRSAFDENRVPVLEDEIVHSVASVLKMYFRELPNPVSTYQLYDDLVTAVRSDSKLSNMRAVVRKLPPPHYRTLGYLMRHLARVAEHGQVTEMTSRNIGIVWAPNLLRSKELESGGLTALQDVGVQAIIAEYLVCNAAAVFR